jgi:transcriptional regulator with GAF, ATPase, and Fis domain
VSKQIREFIIDHNLGLYIAPQLETINILKRQVNQLRKLSLNEEEFLNAVRIDNPQMILGRELLDRLLKIRHAIETTLPILITGETGTGKELVAQLIRKRGPRSRDPYIALNCAGFSDGDNLIDSHLFGHVKGAFTGALANRDGFFKAYSNGTIFLDEVQHLPRGTQGSLKRVLEYKDFTPVGSDKVEETDARLIFAANQSLVAKVISGDFLDDLFYRISAIRFHIPPLRDRMDEIDELINALLIKYRKDFSFMKGKSLEIRALSKLKDYNYPGNIRELQNVLLRACVLSGDSATIGDEHIVFEEISEGPESYHIQTDPGQPTQLKLAGVLKSLKLSVDDLRRRDPSKRISMTSVYENIRNLSSEYRLGFKTAENLRMTYLKDKDKREILRLIELNSPYLRDSLSRLHPFSKWLRERGT